MKNGVIGVGIIGLGTVGSGAVHALLSNAGSIAKKIGAPVAIRRVAVRDTGKPRAVDLPDGIVSSDVDALLADPEVDIVCELIGGIEPARTYISRALSCGKSVVTANKELMARHGGELLDIAEANGVDLLFEGSVGGGIPIIQPLKQALAGNAISEVTGIVNGTTNYILSKMAAEKSAFKDVLAEAQAKGYAEADPAADIEGWDARAKIAILSSIAFNTRIAIDTVTAEGITKLSARDFDVAQRLGYTIKLLGIGTCDASGVRVRVHPTMLKNSHPLSSVNDVYNAVYVRGDSVGDVMFYGRGAGSGPTGSAVVGDIVEIARNLRRGASGRLGCTCFLSLPILPLSTLKTHYCVRLNALDRPRVLAAIAAVFGDFDVSIETVDQHLVDGAGAELVLMTHRTIEQNLTNALDVLSRLPVVERIESCIRVER
jgi:homoserine dehydrogenase